jgi:hypothetical protein
MSEQQQVPGSAGGKLAELLGKYGDRWEIEQLDPGSAWIAVIRRGSFVHILAAHDLDDLSAKLGQADAEDTERGEADR